METWCIDASTTKKKFSAKTRRREEGKRKDEGQVRDQRRETRDQRPQVHSLTLVATNKPSARGCLPLHADATEGGRGPNAFSVRNPKSAIRNSAVAFWYPESGFAGSTRSRSWLRAQKDQGPRTAGRLAGFVPTAPAPAHCKRGSCAEPGERRDD